MPTFTLLNNSLDGIRARGVWDPPAQIVLAVHEAAHAVAVLCAGHDLAALEVAGSEGRATWVVPALPADPAARDAWAVDLAAIALAGVCGERLLAREVRRGVTAFSGRDHDDVVAALARLPLDGAARVRLFDRGEARAREVVAQNREAIDALAWGLLRERRLDAVGIQRHARHLATGRRLDTFGATPVLAPTRRPDPTLSAAYDWDA